jgi:lipid-A-disaccharide synthase
MSCLLRRIRESADAVIAAEPDVLVIIDSPGFTHWVARLVLARVPQIPIVDYVSPQMCGDRAAPPRLT